MFRHKEVKHRIPSLFSCLENRMQSLKARCFKKVLRPQDLTISHFGVQGILSNRR